MSRTKILIVVIGLLFSCATINKFHNPVKKQLDTQNDHSIPKRFNISLREQLMNLTMIINQR